MKLYKIVRETIQYTELVYYDPQGNEIDRVENDDHILYDSADEAEFITVEEMREYIPW